MFVNGRDTPDSRENGSRHPKSGSTAGSGPFSKSLESERRIRPVAQKSPVDLLKKFKLAAHGSDERQLLVTELARWYGENDVQSGFEWLKTLDEFGDDGTGYRCLALTFAAKNPGKWEQFIPRDGPKYLKDAFIAGALAGVTNQDPQQAWQQVEALAKRNVVDSTLKDATLYAIMGSDENFGWDLIARTDGDPGLSKSEVEAYFQRIGYRDPVLAVSRLFVIKDPATQQAAWSVISKSAPDEAIEPMAQSLLDRGPSNNTNIGLSQLIKRYYHKNPVVSAVWCNQITDQKLFDETKKIILSYGGMHGKELVDRIHRELGE